VSPLVLRRYRAERLLRRDFYALRATVLAAVRRRLGVVGARLDSADLEACYAQAWQGLYATMLAGQEVLNPTGWLVQVTFRRAIEEARAARGSTVTEGWESVSAASEPDAAQRLDDRVRLRQVFEALRLRLRGRECQAASLCYLQGLSRAEAAARMGISEARMRKLMDGAGAGQPGVAAKVGELLGTIAAGRWCDEQASLMRGLAFGLLEPGGERHRLALAHQRECPACRAYVASLRGLASALPPLGLPVGIGAAGAGAAGAGAAGSAVGASGAAAGGGWLLAGGPLSAKLAVGCALALSVGAGCLMVSVPHPSPARLPRPAHEHAGVRHLPAAALRVVAPALLISPPKAAAAPARPGPPVLGPRPAPTHRVTAASVPAGARAQREFGLEGPAAPRPGVASAPVTSSPVSASAARVSPSPSPSPSSAPGPASHAKREFGFE
jgi:DNA-directed RNA polymerase specialized sigma24 family protein